MNAVNRTIALGFSAALLVSSALANSTLVFTPGEGNFNWDAYDALASTDLRGNTVTVLGPWVGPEQEAIENVLAYFADATGADVRYTGSDTVAEQAMRDAEMNKAAHISIFPQPSLAADMAKRGFLAPLGAETEAWVNQHYAAGQSWADLGSFADADGNDTLYGFFYNVDVKSLVWYSPAAFDDAGYSVPTTLDELKALSDRIVSDGDTPWCMGIGDGDATGWPATDWVSELMLRSQPPEIYDQWVTNELAFDDPAVIAALNAYGEFARTDGYVAGGADAIASTDYQDSPNGLFDLPPTCYLYRHASSKADVVPDGAEFGVDADIFYLPASTDVDLGTPVLAAGALFTLTHDSDAARALMEFLKKPIAHEIGMAQGDFLSPHNGSNPALYPDALQRKRAETLLGATTIRFSASDLMPAAIGEGTFRTGMVDFTQGAPTDEVATAIQKHWDALQ